VDKSLAIRDSELTVQTLDDVLRLGEVFAKSGMFADVKDAAQAVVKIMAGRELGLPPLFSMTRIYMVKGQVALSATAMAALIKASGRYDYRIVRLTSKEAVIDMYDSGQAVYRSTFTIDDAKAAGVAGGDNYRRFPRNMLFARALSNGARFVCPHILAGVYVREELGEAPDEGDIVVPEADVADAEPATAVSDVEPQASAEEDEGGFLADQAHERLVRETLIKARASKELQDTLIDYWRGVEASRDQVRNELSVVLQNLKHPESITSFWGAMADLGLSSNEVYELLQAPTEYIFDIGEALETVKARLGEVVGE